jgi:hypothetical protein
MSRVVLCLVEFPATLGFFLARLVCLLDISSRFLPIRTRTLQIDSQIIQHGLLGDACS